MRKFQYGFFDCIDYSKELKIDPRVVMNQQGVDEIINQVLEGADSKDIKNQELLDQLLAVDALILKDKLQIAFPLFLVDDFEKIQLALKPTIAKIISIIENHKESIYQGLRHLDSRFSPQHHAYFTICAGL
ncbi:hypothetical protein IMX26_15015 [Clostridium sp. 'deep sea']|uniref:hypothetical protein n=1 Tax=Clostridium sp. 'deep sea' TaxID=2779445 RepID=UPI00189678E1|nr:hypothetical protein [Clostridium sp. 'deep sea']QOR34753.1 hypothetical protein IMX26_15015 [Clostridium sp. 'deep sea']